MSEPDEAMVEAVAQVLWEGNSTPFICWADLSEPLREMQYEQARAALSVPVVRDALARDAQVREHWPVVGRLHDHWCECPLPPDAPCDCNEFFFHWSAIAALYPSPGDRDDSEEQR